MKKFSPMAYKYKGPDLTSGIIIETLGDSLGDSF